VRTLILGLGNPLRRDDGVGIKVARSLREEGIPAEVEVLEAATSGLDLLEIITEYERVIIVDAIVSGEGLPGEIHKLNLSDLSPRSGLVLSHGIDLPTVVRLGEALGLPQPKEIVIFAVEAEDVSSFSEECTPRVEAAIPQVVELVLGELEHL